MSPNELVFCDSAAQKDIYTRHFGAKGGKKSMSKSPLYYNVPVGGVHNILTVKDDGDHARYRRLLAHAFSERALREQVCCISPSNITLGSIITETKQRLTETHVGTINQNLCGSLHLASSRES